MESSRSVDESVGGYKPGARTSCRPDVFPRDFWIDRLWSGSFLTTRRLKKRCKNTLKMDVWKLTCHIIGSLNNQQWVNLCLHFYCFSCILIKQGERGGLCFHFSFTLFYLIGDQLIAGAREASWQPHQQTPSANCEDTQKKVQRGGTQSWLHMKEPWGLHQM